MPKIDGPVGTFNSAVDAFSKNTEKGGEMTALEGVRITHQGEAPKGLAGLPSRLAGKIAELMNTLGNREVPAGRCPFSAQEVHLLNRALAPAFDDLPDAAAKKEFLLGVASDPRLKTVVDLAQGRLKTNDTGLKKAADAFMNARAALYQQAADAGQRDVDARAEELKRAIVGQGRGTRPPSPESSMGTRAPLTPPTGGGVGFKR